MVISDREVAGRTPGSVSLVGGRGMPDGTRISLPWRSAAVPQKMTRDSLPYPTKNNIYKNHNSKCICFTFI